MYLATALKQAGYNPVVVDACVDSDYWNIIASNLAEAVFIGISAMTPQVPHGLELAKKIREKAPGLPLVWGGIHPTLYPDTVLNPYCDVVVAGEGDVTVVELASVLQKVAPGSGVTSGIGGDSDRIAAITGEIPGVVTKRSGEVVHGPERTLLDVGTLPWLDYSLIDAEKYIYSWSLQELRMVRVIPIPGSRGCPWHCTFCINTTLNRKRRYRARSATDLLDEIEHLVRTYRLEMIIFSDEEFFADRQRVEAVLDGIEARGLSGIRFNATCRVNHFRDGYIDSAFLRRMKRCGFVNLLFGFESGSPECLELIRKEITVDQGLYAARLLATEGFMAVWGFIMAIPGETALDLTKTLRVMEKIRKMSPNIYFIGPQIFRPYPGSELYREALQSGLREPASLDEWGRQEFTGEGWLGSAGLPWIRPEDRSFIDYINYIAPVYFNHRYLRSTGLKRWYHAVLRLIFHMRLATECRLFPVEHRIKQLLQKRIPKGPGQNKPLQPDKQTPVMPETSG